ncbi:asparaginyl-tRNA synthetase-like isoform X2 [Halichondria panicea]
MEGLLVESSHSGQAVELLANTLQLGQCNTQEFPFKARQTHTPDYIRQFPHLRARTQSFSSLLRLRDTATALIHTFFRDNGFINVHTPILTSSDCEGAGELFSVKPCREEGDVEEDEEGEFFGCKAYLTVSGQLHAEAIACGMKSVYTFGPTFRAERSHSSRHLSEFYMIEAEKVFLSSELEPLLNLVEDLYKYTVEGLLREREEDMTFYHEQSQSTKEWVMKSLSRPFLRMTYSEAVNALRAANANFQFEPKWGSDLKSEHERYLTHHVGHCPLFVTDYPVTLKPFYARQNSDGETVSGMDLLLPGVGEAVGGSIREEREESLQAALTRCGMLESYQWYMDLRRFGTVPHGGFGLGFERLLQAVLGVKHIRDVTPFPRFLGSCDM